MRAYARMKGGRKRRSFGEGGLRMLTMKELQIHDTYRERKLEFGRGEGLGIGLIEFKDMTTP
jgi:hypothetical protein